VRFRIETARDAETLDRGDPTPRHWAAAPRARPLRASLCLFVARRHVLTWTSTRPTFATSTRSPAPRLTQPPIADGSLQNRHRAHTAGR
jgi:hypothetical protein